jgi:hypothetical protein
MKIMTEGVAVVCVVCLSAVVFGFGSSSKKRLWLFHGSKISWIRMCVRGVNNSYGARVSDRHRTSKLSNLRT